MSRFATEVERLARMQGRVRMLSDAVLEAIRRGVEVGIARELADDEIRRRAGLPGHQRIAERRTR